MAIGEYEAVWLFVGFDLPTLTLKQRRLASRFRKDLIAMGFSMFQLSFYSYYLPSKQAVKTISRKIESMVPPNGKVSIFYITDAQFKMIETFYGGKKVLNDEVEEAVLFE